MLKFYESPFRFFNLFKTFPGQLHIVGKGWMFEDVLIVHVRKFPSTLKRATGKSRDESSAVYTAYASAGRSIRY